MEIFIVENGVVKPTKEILLIFPFSAIWDRDTEIGNPNAIREFSYIEFMVSPKLTNPFHGYDEMSGIRHQKIVANQFRDEPDWEPDELILQAIDQYKEFYYNASPSLSFYEASLVGADKVKNFYLNFDINERNTRTNMPIFSAKGITDSLKNTNGVLKELNAMRETVHQEIYESSKTKGNRQINHFER